MRIWTGAAVLSAAVLSAAVAMAATGAAAQHAPGTGRDEGFRPIHLTLQPEPETVYAPPAPPREEEGINEGAINLSLEVRYMTDYVFRGIEILEPPGAEDALNFQVEGKLSFDLGRMPHPFVGVFVNVAEEDPVSSFQTIVPTVGFDWHLRPLIVSAGYNAYFYPDRDEMDTQEVFGRIELDDSYFLRSDRPLLSPYIYAAYDFDRYDGWYIEAGVGHDFDIENIGLTLRTEASVAYVYNFPLFAAMPGGDDSGFQHYQLGLIGTYSLNTLLNIPRRYGDWSVRGYLYYTDRIDTDLRADTQLWGGVGIRLEY